MVEESSPFWIWTFAPLKITWGPASSLIASGSTELLQKILEDNKIAQDDIASIFFTVTNDLNATFPAAAARTMGMSDVPLLCATEIPVAGALPMCVRMLLHINSEKNRDLCLLFLYKNINQGA